MQLKRVIAIGLVGLGVAAALLATRTAPARAAGSEAR